MQNPRRGNSVGAAPRVSKQAPRASGRSATLQHAGLISAEQPSTPPDFATAHSGTSSSSTAQPLNASGSTAASAQLPTAVGGEIAGGRHPSERHGGEAGPDTPPDSIGAAGLTPASLKHVRRQNTKLTEDKDRLLNDVDRLQALLREARERLPLLEEQVRESAIREESLQTELRETREREEAERKRAEDAERQNVRLEEEVARLKKALRDQLLLTKEVCEAAERSTGEARAVAESAEEIARLNEQVKKLIEERDQLLKDRERQNSEYAEMQKRTAIAMAAAEKAMSMHAAFMQSMEQLRTAKLSEAIQHKVELHISVPRVTLSYNNAPPLQVSAAAALGDNNRIKDFMELEVMPNFEPLWVTLDGLDQAPDGTTKKAYSARMLDRLTDAVKGFIEKSQRSEPDGGLKPSIRESLHSGMGLGSADATAQASRSTTATSGTGAPRSLSGSLAMQTGTGGAAVDGTAPRSRASAGAAGGCAMDSLADVDKEHLLGLLRSSDDRGLDGKLQELLQSRA